jgi:enoyl-CoA hydratase
VSTFETLVYHQREHIAVITMNRPEALNARNIRMREELLTAVQDASDDPEVRVVILTGTGRAFSVGRDLKEAAASAPSGPIEARASRALSTNDTRVLELMPKPVIAAINGLALGGGLELALCCDLRIVSEGAQLGLPEAARGIMPGGGGTQRLPRLIGRALALQMMFTAEPLSAQEALRIGLVNQVVPADELMPTAEAMARSMVSRAPLSLRFIKESVRKGLDLSLDEGLALEGDLATILATSEDSREGPRAFVEKRPPVWKGR